MIKEPIFQEDRILNVYVFINSAAKYVKQKLIESKEDTDKSTFTVGDVNAPFLATNRSREKTNMHTELNTIHQQDLTDTYRTHHPTMAAHILSKYPQNIQQDMPYPQS